MKKIIKTSFYLFTIVCLLCSCRYNINNLDQQEIGFDSLPSIVQDTLIALSQPGCNDYSSIIFLDNHNGRYSEEVLKSGPFIDGTLVIDGKDGKKYIVDRGTAHPYIIYDNFLYHPLEYNVLFMSKVHNAKFMKYKLK